VQLDSDEKKRVKEAKWAGVMQRKESNLNRRNSTVKNNLAKSFTRMKEIDVKMRESKQIIAYKTKTHNDHY
jgi:hypothetical protein